MDSDVVGVAIMGDTIADGGHLRSYGIRSTLRAGQFRVGTISFVVWAVGQYLITNVEIGK